MMEHLFIIGISSTPAHLIVLFNHDSQE
uniref:Uncharacterized protein n=1 Tax=Anguilla anguilla TaxID=7936 RepID=A0A0E9PX87_ANGAN